MIYARILSDFLFFFFALFAVSSTFSIALAQISLGVSFLLYLIILLLKKENPFGGNLKIFYSTIGLYLLWMFITSLFGERPFASIVSLKEEWLFCVIPIGIYLFQKESFRKKIFISFAVAICIVSIYGIAQHFTGIHWFKKNPLLEAFDLGYRAQGFFSHVLTFGNYFAVVSMFLLGYLVTSWKNLNLNWRLFLSISLLLAVTVTLFSYGYGPMVAVVGSVICLGFLLSKKYMLYSLAFLTLVISVSLFSNATLRERILTRIQNETDISNEESRIYIWNNALTMTKQNPIFGVGQGNFNTEFEKNMPGHKAHSHAHNDFFNFAAIAGIPGFLIYCSIWFMFFRTIFLGWKKNRLLSEYHSFFVAGLLGAVAFLLTSLTEATFADEEVRQLLMLIWAFSLFPLISKENKERN